MNSKQTAVFSVLIILGIALGIYTAKFFARKDDNPYSHMGGDFKLHSTDGSVTLQSLAGNVVVLYFGFTSCPSVCPTSLSHLNATLNLLDEKDRNKVKAIFISVDYKRDTPIKVKEYAEFFSKNIIGLTGNEKEIRDITKKYGVYFDFVEIKDSAMRYTVDHTSRYYIIDKKGQLQSSLIDKEPKEKILETIKQFI